MSQIEQMHDYIDIFQVGARNAQNFNLLDALGQVDKPVMLKRGISGSLEELLQAAEYVFSNETKRSYCVKRDTTLRKCIVTHWILMQYQF